VAFAMVTLGMGTGSVPTALDLDEGLAYLDRHLMMGTARRAIRRVP
jgi:rsbT antagonist protein RsbS